MTDGEYREVYRNAMVHRGGAQLFTGVAWTLQAALLVCVGLTFLVTGVAVVVAAFGEDGWVLSFGVVLVGLAAAALYLPVELWRKGGRPMIEARRQLRAGQPLATVEGVASASGETLRVADKTFDLAMTLTNATRLGVDGAYVRVTYVPDTGLLATVEVRDH